MGRSPCCDKGVKKGPWTPEEDIALVSYIQEHGPGNWRAVPVHTGLMRCSKSCRLRWTNYLRPGIKRGNFTPYEDRMIVHLQALLGNRWAAIASYLPQRTDNDIKNYWNTHLKKRLKKMQLQHTGEMNHAELLKPPAGSGSSAAGKGQWESRLQTDIQYAKQALLEALNMGSAAAASFSPSSCNSLQNSAQTSCNYAASVENLSRLLEGWKQSQSNSQVQPKKEEMQEFGAMNMNMNVNMDMSTTSTQSCSSSQNSETAMADVKMEDAAAAAVATATAAWTPASAFNSPRGDGCDDGSSINELDIDLGRPSGGANAGSGAGASATEEPEQELPLSMLEKWLMEESLQAQDRSNQHFSLTECLQDQPWQTC